eukprot:2777983-Alexandrium_andersonii.AAC.1
MPLQTCLWKHAMCGWPPPNIPVEACLCKHACGSMPLESANSSTNMQGRLRARAHSPCTRDECTACVKERVEACGDARVCRLAESGSMPVQTCLWKMPACAGLRSADRGGIRIVDCGLRIAEWLARVELEGG